MANNKTEQRYPGIDATPWTIKGSTGKAVVFKKGSSKSPEEFNSFKDAQFAAQNHTRDTGEFAQPIRK